MVKISVVRNVSEPIRVSMQPTLHRFGCVRLLGSSSIYFHLFHGRRRKWRVLLGEGGHFCLFCNTSGEFLQQFELCATNIKTYFTSINRMLLQIPLSFQVIRHFQESLSKEIIIFVLAFVLSNLHTTNILQSCLGVKVFFNLSQISCNSAPGKQI